MLLQGRIEFLGQVVGYIRHPRLLLIGAAQATLILIGLLVVLLLAIFAVARCALVEKSFDVRTVLF